MRQTKTVLASVSAAVAALCAMPVSAAQNNDDLGGLEEVVVTARFREELLQQTPLAVSAITAEGLEMRGMDDVDSIGAVVPNAYFRQNGATPLIGIRGKINADELSFSKPTVAVYTDDVYWARQTGMNFNLYDVERVEVLRGPQGTLFGKNALGGAVRVISKEAKGDDTGYLEVKYGRFNQMDFKGALDMGLTDDLYMRITGMSESRDGYIDQLDFTCTMIEEGTPELAGIGDGIIGATPAGTALGQTVYAPVFGTVGSPEDNAFSFPQVAEDRRAEAGVGNPCKLGTYRGIDRQGGRVQFRYVGVDNLDISLTADVMNDNSEAWSPIPFEGGSNLTPNDIAWINADLLPRWGIRPETFTGGTDDPLDGAFYRDPRQRETFETWRDPTTGENFNLGERVLTWGLTGKLVWSINDNMQLTYLSAFRQLETAITGRSGTTQGDGTPFDTIHNAVRQYHKQYQNEARLEGVAFDNKLDWTVGAFWFTTDESEIVNVDIEPLKFFKILELYHFDEFETDNKSAFLHGVYHVTDKLAVTAGLRYTDESNTVMFRHYPALIAAAPSVATASRYDWKLGVDYKFTEEHFAYASAATGFRSAGVQSRPWTVGQLKPFPEEEVLSYEVGYKGDFFNRRLRVNVAGFFDDYDPRILNLAGRQCSDANDPDPQYYRVQDLVDTNGDGVGDVCPAGTVFEGNQGLNYALASGVPTTVYGAELEATANPLPNLTLNYTFGYNKFTSSMDDVTDPAYIHPDAIIQPRITMSAGVQYDVDLQSGARLVPRLDWSYQSKNTVGALNIAPQPDQILAAHSLFNARLTYVSPNDVWQTSLAIENLFDKFYWIHHGSGTGYGVPGSPAPPRQWTVTLRRNFQ
ncbi:MAG: TonB-dependent receptor [Nevskiaceae bacterium]|jgi:iron complex outermembrane receptor protein|nr:TonB-dependent receptor [Nevskiaceae bacterium]